MFSKFRKPLIEDKESTVGLWLLCAAFVYLYGRVFHFVFDQELSVAIDSKIYRRILEPYLIHLENSRNPNKRWL